MRVGFHQRCFPKICFVSLISLVLIQVAHVTSFAVVSRLATATWAYASLELPLISLTADFLAVWLLCWLVCGTADNLPGMGTRLS